MGPDRGRRRASHPRRGAVTSRAAQDRDRFRFRFRFRRGAASARPSLSLARAVACGGWGDPGPLFCGAVRVRPRVLVRAAAVLPLNVSR